MILRFLINIVVLLFCFACNSKKKHTMPVEQSSASEVVSVSFPASNSAPGADTRNSNPLSLPEVHIKLPASRRVFAVSESMLQKGTLGSSFVFYAAKVLGAEGNDIRIEGLNGESYRVHPGYVIPAMDNPVLGVHQPVVTEWNGTLHHAIVLKVQKDRVQVRYTDMEGRTADLSKERSRFVIKTEGLVRGNHAAWKDSEGMYKHVFLVSSFLVNGIKKWFVLGFAGVANIVDEKDLVAIPNTGTFRSQDVVLASWLGTLRKAVITDISEIGSYSVRFERIGKAEHVGWGFLLADR